MTKKRSLKVYSKFNRIGREYRSQIRLEGSWLQNAGFYIGDQISIFCEDNRLIIERVDDTPDPDPT